MANAHRLSHMPLKFTFVPPRDIRWSFIWLRVLPLSILTLVALIPTRYYVTEDRADWLTIIGILLFLPRPILALRTIVSAVGSVNDEMRANRWDVLILTGISARKIVWGKWLYVVRQTAFDHVTFALLHIGFALAVAQYMNVVFYGKPLISQILLNYRYLGAWNLYLNPSPTVFIIGFCVIVLFGLLECGLVCAIGVATAFIWKRQVFGAYLLGVAHYITLLMVVFGIWFYTVAGSGWDSYQKNFCFGNWNWGSASCGILSWRTYNRIFDTLQIAFFTPLDQGTLLAANIMRPYDTRITDIEAYDSFGNMTFYTLNYDNRAFVARNLLAALLGAGVYAFLTRAYLRRATHFAIINHSASGYLEL